MSRKRLCILVFVLLLVTLALGLSPVTAQTSSTIRVYLRRLQITDSVQIEVNGTYMLEDGSMFFADGTQMSVALRNNQLVLHVGQVAMQMGTTLRRVSMVSRAARASV